MNDNWILGLYSQNQYNKLYGLISMTAIQNILQ